MRLPSAKGAIMADKKKILELIEQAAKESWTELDLSNNQLTKLPSEIAKLTKLTYLNLRNNQLTIFPANITKLTNLTRLDLRKNQLRKVPTEVTKLISLTTLSLRENDLTSLPPDIANLINLTTLGLCENRLASLPPEIAKLINLGYLDLSYNQLTNLPPEITKLKNLSYLNLKSNQLPIPPETLANSMDVRAIFYAITGLASGKRLNEAKMLVVGDGKVGKSSVVERLIYDTYDPHKETTLGIEISDEMKIVQGEVKGEGEPVKLNVWDFGGQEIQHSTHQFFLTTRSLYLLVVDARKGNQISNIEYWLKLIESFAGDSPIVVAINQIDQLKGQRPLNLDRKALQGKYNIRDFVETSCETGEGIPILKKTITHEVEQMRHVRDFWPREWLGVKERLKRMPDDYIPVEKYLEICVEESLTDSHLQMSLLGLLHDLGTIIRFPGDTQVLNPRWVTQGVYGLLTSAQLVKEQGQFDLIDVGKILASLPDAKEHYPSHTHERLVRVMEHFELCFEFTDRPGHYLIPRHLHDNELDIPWDESDALKFQYHYETLPDSIISRFIVRMNQYITKQYYWKSGVFLHSDENRAKVKADLVDRRIFISIIGKEHTRGSFLAVIRSVFDEINSKFKIEIKRMIPLPDYPSILISYDELLIYDSNNKPLYFVATRGVEKDYVVRYLLKGVQNTVSRPQSHEPDLYENRFKHQAASLAKNSPVDSILAYSMAFVLLLGAIVGAAIAISGWVSMTAGIMTGVVIIGTLLAYGVVGATHLRSDDRLSEDNFLKLMIESYKRLRLLKGKNDSNHESDQ
jgi:internalin A